MKRFEFDGRSRTERRTLLLGLALLWSCGLGPAEPVGGPAPAEADLSLLFIGNSLTYTNDLPGMLERLLEGHGGLDDVYVESLALPNFGLQDHWAIGQAAERIRAGGWDYVIMQQGPSATEGRPSLLEYSARFAEAIPTGGRAALYMVWPSEARSFDFDGVSDSYRTAAEMVDGLLFPAGEAWRAAWERDPGLALYGPDGFHPSALGTYVAAVVMYEQLSGQPPAALPARIPGPAGPVPIAVETAAALHAAAAAANAAFARN